MPFVTPEPPENRQIREATAQTVKPPEADCKTAKVERVSIVVDVLSIRQWSWIWGRSIKGCVCRSACRSPGTGASQLSDEDEHVGAIHRSRPVPAVRLAEFGEQFVVCRPGGIGGAFHVAVKIRDASSRPIARFKNLSRKYLRKIGGSVLLSPEAENRNDLVYEPLISDNRYLRIPVRAVRLASPERQIEYARLNNLSL